MKPYAVIKRILDFVFALIILIILSPIFLIIALLIKIDSKGAVLFKQDRLGKNGEVFKIYKFRTMCQNAEKKGSGIYTYEEDPRITKIGRLLRKTSLDELPQLINIIKGEMSFIGPRPPVPYHPYKYEEYPMDAKRRFDVLPGMSGYAQINGRTDISWPEKFKYDIEYVNNYSFRLDAKIFFLTIYNVFARKDIYSNKVNNKKYIERESNTEL